MNKRVLFAAGLLLLTTRVHAEDMPVYESLSTLEIGRVFLTQSQRDELDRRRSRGDRSAVASGGSRSQKSVRSTSPDAAGYIVSDSGETRIWKRGDFVRGEESDTDKVTFPGEVRVKRHEHTSRDE